MQVIHKCRNLLFLRNLLNISSTQIAEFHSTPICCQKWKNKSNHDCKPQQQSSKNQVKFAIRQQRANRKKTIQNFLNYDATGTTFHLLVDEPRKPRSRKSYGTDSTKKKYSKSEYTRAEKIQNRRMRRNFRRKSRNQDDDEYPETIYEAAFGGRLNTEKWSFYSRNAKPRHSSPHFDWRDAFHIPYMGQEQNTAYDYEYKTQKEGYNVGLPADRAVLGLSPKGPLTLKAVKNAFHVSALKWHPDKHQGPTQAAAEEKFKLCVTAYQSLCNALSAA